MQLGFIVTGANAESVSSWVLNMPVLVQAVLSNVVAQGSDLFQARKNILLAFTALAIVGAFIIPGSSGPGRILAGQTLIGFGNTMMALTFSIPSEILPTRWRTSRYQYVFVFTSGLTGLSKWRKQSLAELVLLG
jgi:hypothetical protein